MRYRGSSKISFRHHCLPGLRKLLESIEPWEEVRAILPGTINPQAGRGPLQITVRHRTANGLKCLVKANRGTQEVFLVTSDPERLAEKLKEMFPEAPSPHNHPS